MWWFILTLPAWSMSAEEAVQAAVARSPALAVSEARVTEASGRLSEVRARLMPSASMSATALAQTTIEVDLSDKIPLPLATPPDPLLVMPGAQLQAGVQGMQPLVVPSVWAGRRAAQHGVTFAKSKVDGDKQALTGRVVQAFHRSAEAHAMLDDAVRAEALAGRLLQRGETLVELGAAARHEVLPFERAHATARARVAQTQAAVHTVDGVLFVLTGLQGGADEPPVPTAAPDLAGLLSSVQRADLRMAEHGASAAASQVRVQRAAVYPSVALQGAVMAATPAPDFGKGLTWRVGVGAQIPLFQGGVVSSRVRQAQAKVSAAEAGVRASRERAELEVRVAHGELVGALTALDAQAEAVAIGGRAVAAAETRLGEGGGSLLQLQQAQLELVAAQAAQTRARASAARAADALTLAARGAL